MKSGSAEDVSGLTYTMVLVGAILWASYGVARGAPAIILWNIVAAALAAAVLYFKLRPAKT
jgi:hypothetical protein